MRSQHLLKSEDKEYTEVTLAVFTQHNESQINLFRPSMLCESGIM